jgi:hypothetical protein
VSRDVHGISSLGARLSVRSRRTRLRPPGAARLGKSGGLPLRPPSPYTTERVSGGPALRPPGPSARLCVIQRSRYHGYGTFLAALSIVNLGRKHGPFGVDMTSHRGTNHAAYYHEAREYHEWQYD